MKLCILIPTLISRRESLKKLLAELDRQIKPFGRDVIYKIEEDNGEMSTGAKSNRLIQKAIDYNASHVCRFDDDDDPSPDYVKLVMQGVYQDVDCCSLKGIITENGQNPLIFEHSIKYHEYKTNPEGMEVRYERFPNHLNAIKLSIALQFPYPDISHGEDTDFATQVYKSGLLKVEHYIPEVIYHYKWVTK